MSTITKAQLEKLRSFLGERTTTGTPTADELTVILAWAGITVEKPLEDEVFFPLGELDFDDGDPVFIKVLYDLNSGYSGSGYSNLDKDENVGWVRRCDGWDWRNIDDGESINRNPCPKTTLARLLRPGEKLTIG